jgi:hypothetical protein
MDSQRVNAFSSMTNAPRGLTDEKTVKEEERGEWLCHTFE